MKKTVIKCDRCDLEQEVSSLTSKPTGWLALSPETDLCPKCANEYDLMQESLTQIREEFFNGSRETKE